LFRRFAGEAAAASRRGDQGEQGSVKVLVIQDDIITRFLH
jgi:hypothetical protein